VKEYTDLQIVIPSENDRIIYLCEEIILESVLKELLMAKKETEKDNR